MTDLKKSPSGVTVEVTGGGGNTDEVVNVSAVPGANASDALDWLLAAIGRAVVREAPLLTNADATLSLVAGSLFTIPAATYTAPRTLTIDRLGLPGTTPGRGSLLLLLVLDTTANSKTVVDAASGLTIMSIPGGTAAGLYLFVDDGNSWVYVPSQIRVTPS